MSTALLIVAVATALACPLHTVWAMRRGKRAVCCPPRAQTIDAERLRQRQRELGAELARRATADARSAGPRS